MLPYGVLDPRPAAVPVRTAAMIPGASGRMANPDLNSLVGDIKVTSLYRFMPAVVGLTTIIALTGCGEYGNAATEPAPVRKASVTTSDGSESKPQIAESTPSEPVNVAGLDAPSKRRAEIKAADQPEAAASEVAVSTVVLEPAQLDLGTVPANQYASGSVTLVNKGDEAVTITDCRTSCGCTTTNCPKGQKLEPGESTEVAVRMTAGSRPRRISKTVTFVVENQPLLKMPVSVEVISYVTIEPTTIDPERSPEGRVVIQATDGEPFRIVSMQPDLIPTFDPDPLVEHEIYIDWDRWRELGETRRLNFTLDHPKATQVSLLVRTNNPVARNRDPRISDRLAPDARQNQAEIAADAPIEFLEPDAKLAVAIKRGDLELISTALESGGVPDPVRDSMLSMAARYGQVEIIESLIKHGANVEAKDKRGRTALMSAVQSHNTEAIKALIAGGAKVDDRDEVEGTALFRASGPFGDVAVVDALLAAGAEVNVADKNGMTPLIWAVRFGDPARVQALVKAGAEVDARDARGLTAVDYAKNRRDKESAKKIEDILSPNSEDAKK